jgi:phospholipid/cholesterol/gamma-HCH transport system permease protein
VTRQSRTDEPGLRPDPQAGTLQFYGPWLTCHLHKLIDQSERLSVADAPRVTRFDASEITHLDTAGAWLLLRLAERSGQPPNTAITGLTPAFAQLLTLVAEQKTEPLVTQKSEPIGILAGIGRYAWPYLQELLGYLAFVGETSSALWRVVRDPRRFRFKPLLDAIDDTGVRAVPIVALLSFLLGMVIAYQGSIQLRSYGANIFIVELVTLTIVRELGPMMTAIIIAGRTGAAYTAELGTMKVSEEIDALRTLSIPPVELLVLPRVLGLLLSLPLLTLIADVMGVVGGMVIAASLLGVSYQDFFYRIPNVVSLNSYLVGIVKAPAFATIVGLMGCYQGLAVTGGADAVGRQTTLSVVKSIFSVIVADAVFSILFGWLKI